MLIPVVPRFRCFFSSLKLMAREGVLLNEEGGKMEISKPRRCHGETPVGSRIEGEGGEGLLHSF